MRAVAGAGCKNRFAMEHEGPDGSDHQFGFLRKDLQLILLELACLHVCDLGKLNVITQLSIFPNLVACDLETASSTRLQHLLVSSHCVQQSPISNLEADTC